MWNNFILSSIKQITVNKIRLRGWLTWKSGDVHDCHTCPIKKQYVIVLWVPVFRWAANVLFLCTVKNGCSSLPRRFAADSAVSAIDVSPTKIIDIVFVLFLGLKPNLLVKTNLAFAFYKSKCHPLHPWKQTPGLSPSRRSPSPSFRKDEIGVVDLHAGPTTRGSH